MRHMQAESRETAYKEKERRDPYMNSGGRFTVKTSTVFLKASVLAALVSF